MADFNEVAELFHIFKAAHEHGDQFKHIRDAALERLRAINEEHAPQKEESVVEEPEQEPAEEPEPGVDGEDGRRA